MGEAMLTLAMKRLPASTRGIYGPSQDQLPQRMLLLAPDVAPSFAAVEADSGGLVYSDVYRSAEGSLQAMQTKRGVQPPAYSGHGFGLCLDIAVDETLKLRGWTYAQLLDFMSQHGWYCYRRDGQRGMEDWHQTYLGPLADEILAASSGRADWWMAAELAITKRYGDDFALTAAGIQTCLAKLKFYSGEVDGLLGPLSRQAAAAFCRAWNVDPAQQARFQRTLAFVAADLNIEELPAA